MLCHRIATLSGVAAIFVVSMMAFGLVPAIFFPPSDDPRFKLEIDLPPSTAIEHTEFIVEQLEQYIDANLLASEQHEGIVNYTTFIGTGGPRIVMNHSGGRASPNTAFFLFNTTSDQPIENLMNQLRSHLFENYPDVSVSLRKFENGAAVDKPVQVRVSGDSIDKLYQLSDKIKLKLESLAGTTAIKDDWGAKVKKIVIKVNEAAARRVGVTSTDIAKSLNTSFSGK